MFNVKEQDELGPSPLPNQLIDMSEKEILQSVIEFIHAKFPLAKKKAIGESESLLNSGVVDSMGILEIVTFVEDEYSIELTDEEVMEDNFETIQSIADLIVKKSGASA